jgi:hypothetical protein
MSFLIFSSADEWPASEDTSACENTATSTFGYVPSVSRESWQWLDLLQRFLVSGLFPNALQFGLVLGCPLHQQPRGARTELARDDSERFDMATTI